MMQTDRIILRSWSDSDVETLFKYASDPEVGLCAGWLARSAQGDAPHLENP